MKQRLLLFVCTCWLMLAATAQDSLRFRLDSLLRDPMFETSQVGLMVYDLTADSMCYTRNERQLLRPASCMKLVTAITALDRLGSGYKYKTRIYYSGTIADSTLVGDIYCVGGFDPMLSGDDVDAIADSICRLGIDSISGGLYADRSMKEALDYGEGWCWDDDNPLLTPLGIGRKDVFVETLAKALEHKGVRRRVSGDGRQEACLPAGTHLIATRSHGITEVLQRMLKMSDNFYAESMFYQTAAAVKRPGRAKDARDVTKKLFARLGLGHHPYKVADGSGLSLYNYVSAELLCRLLRYAWQREDIRLALLSALPIAGVDGTLKERMRKTSAQGNVRAKTGTLTGISSLAGYCRTADGHDLCFAIINQGVMRNKAGKDFQDRVCLELTRTIIDHE